MIPDNLVLNNRKLGRVAKQIEERPRNSSRITNPDSESGNWF